MEDVLKNAPTENKPQKSKSNISGVSILLTIILLFVLIALGEKLFFDLNKSFNPRYDECYNYRTRIYSEITSQAKYPTKTTAIVCNAAVYKLNQILLHAVLAIPLLLGAVILYFYTHLKTEKKYYSILTWAYFIMAIWLIMHLIWETGYFMIKRYETWGIYIVLIPLVAVLTWLIIFIQKKVGQKRVTSNENPHYPLLISHYLIIY